MAHEKAPELIHTAQCLQQPNRNPQEVGAESLQLFLHNLRQIERDSQKRMHHWWGLLNAVYKQLLQANINKLLHWWGLMSSTWPQCNFHALIRKNSKPEIIHTDIWGIIRRNLMETCKWDMGWLPALQDWPIFRYVLDKQITARKCIEYADQDLVILLF